MSGWAPPPDRERSNTRIVQVSRSAFRWKKTTDKNGVVWNTLEQMWSTITYDRSEIVHQVDDWRPVPTVTE